MTTSPGYKASELQEKGSITSWSWGPFFSHSLDCHLSSLTLLSVLCVSFSSATLVGSRSPCPLCCHSSGVIGLSDYKPHLNQASQSGQNAPAGSLISPWLVDNKDLTCLCPLDVALGVVLLLYSQYTPELRVHVPLCAVLWCYTS